MSSPPRSGWMWFSAWAVAGVVLGVALIGALTIGLFVLPVGIVIATLLGTRRPDGSTLCGLVSGVGLPFLYVAYLNRSGPGNVCTPDECTEMYNPWLPLTIAVVLAALGIVGYLLLRRRRVSGGGST